MTLKNRRTLRIPALTAFALGLCAVSAQAKPNAQQVASLRAIKAEYARADRAIIKKDLTGVMAMCAPDFTCYTNTGAQLNLAQFKAVQKSTIDTPGIRFNFSTTKIQKIQWRGVDAIVWTYSVLTWTQQGIPVRATGETRDYWRPTKAGWQVSQSVILNSKMMVNGKEIQRR